MANAARMHLVEKGRDPRGYSVIAFGGAGPLHAYRVAERLKLKTLICPLAAGVTSAFGMLTAPLAFDFVQSYVTMLSELDCEVFEGIYTDLEQRGRSMLATAGVESGVTLTRSADMRYVQQGVEIRVALPTGRLTPENVPALRHVFELEYERLYKRLNPGVDIEIVNWRLVASGPQPQITLQGATLQNAAGLSLAAARKGERAVYMPEQEGFVPCPVYDRYVIPAGETFSGPAIVEERECTVVIGAHAHARLDAEQNLVITLE